MTRFLLLALIGLTTSGCGYEFSDDVDLELDFFDLFHSNDLHSPYAPGAGVTIWADGYGGAREDVERWRFETSDPSVARVVASSGDRASVEMVAPGTTTLLLLRDDQVIGSTPIEVGTPVEADLVWHGDLLLGRSEETARLEEARVLVGETGAFLVRFRDERGRLLSGNGALRVEAPAEAGAEVRQTFLFERRDWLMLTPTSEGEHEVSISAGDTPIDAFLVTGVRADVVESVVIEGQSEVGRSAGEELVLVAHAEDSEGRPIFGVDYVWDVGGVVVAGLGDVLRYTFAPSSPTMVGASIGEDRGETMISASGPVVIDDTANIGCSASGVEAVGASAPLALLSLFLTWPRRRRPPSGQGI